MLRKFTYGPFKSRRLGLSLGVNILREHKICSFNCVYCEIGSTKNECLVSPHYKIDIKTNNKFSKELKSILNHYPHLDSITFGYYGETTLNRNIDEFVRITEKVRKQIKWKDDPPKLTLFTNSSTLFIDEIRKKIKRFDVILAKLDVGTQEDFLRTNRPHKEVPKLDEIVKSLTKLKKELNGNTILVIQSLIYNSYKEDFLPNTTPTNISGLAKALKEIKPDVVQIYSVARIPTEYYVYSIDTQEKQNIVNKLKRLIDDETIKIKYY
jgi:wyosine [tRNA(Phe)-imidazoG37] synthetase (radical SAM superfamily)